MYSIKIPPYEKVTQFRARTDAPKNGRVRTHTLHPTKGWKSCSRDAAREDYHKVKRANDMAAFESAMNAVEVKTAMERFKEANPL